MYPKQHFLYGTIFGIILWTIFSEISLLEAGIVIAASVLIDVDHYIYYIFDKKDLSLKNAYALFSKEDKAWKKLPRKERNKMSPPPFFLHGIEPLTIIALLGFYVSPLFYYIALGFIFHLILDYIELWKYADLYNKISVIRDYLFFR